jgi:hypothetical protein
MKTAIVCLLLEYDICLKNKVAGRPRNLIFKTKNLPNLYESLLFRKIETDEAA